MSKGSPPKRKGKGSVVVDGHWLPMSCEFLGSRHCAELSPLALKLMMMFLGQLRAGGIGNGRLDMGRPRLIANGFSSRASAYTALKELEQKRLVLRTLQGAKGRLSLFAVTLLPMSCKPEGLDVGPGAYRIDDWRRTDPTGAAAPTQSAPAVWARSRAVVGGPPTRAPGKLHVPCSRSGTALTVALPQRESIDACCPVAGAQLHASAPNAVPLREPLLDSHLQGALGQEVQPARDGARQPMNPDAAPPLGAQAECSALADVEAFE